MAASKNEQQVTWSASNSASVTAGGSQTSDAVTASSTMVDQGIMVKADNAGTPASGDTVDFYLLPTTGDPDGAGSDEYVTAGHGYYLGQVDTNLEDPAIAYYEIPSAMKGWELYAASNAASNSITVSAAAYETLFA